MAVTAAACALAACAHVPEHTTSHPKAPGDYAVTRAFAGPQADWPTEDWWTTYGDAQLTSLVNESLSHSPSLDQARARLHEAQAAAGLEKASQLPTVGFDAGVQDEKLTYNGIFPRAAVPKGWNDEERASLGFNWEIDFWGKNRAALDAALSSVKASQAEAAAARVLLTTNVVGSYARLQGMFIESDMAAQALQNQQASAQLVHRRFAEGLEALGAVELADARVDSARARAAEVDEQLKLARNEIAALLGKGPDAGLEVQRAPLLARRPVGLPTTLSADLLGRKPEVVAARLRADAASQRIGVAKADFYPNVNLAGLIGLDSLGLSKFTDSGSTTGNFGVALHLPIFDGGRLRARYGQASAEYELAVASYDAAVTQALRETADALQSLRSLTERANATQAALESSERAYAIARKRYEGGLADYQSVLSAEDGVLQLRVADTNLRVRGLSLDVALVRALGGGTVDLASNESKVTQ